MTNMEQISFKKEVDIVITPQAQKVIASSKYSLEDFKQWALIDQKISLGGYNATVFLEVMYNKEADE